MKIEILQKFYQNCPREQTERKQRIIEFNFPQHLSLGWSGLK